MLRDKGTQVPIWLRPEGGSRGPRPARSRADLAAAGIRIADAHGIEAVSFRKVADELGTGTSTLYRYVTGKDELLDLMIDAAVGERRPPEPTGDRRADLRALAEQYRAMMLRHPWLAAMPAARPALGPNNLAWLEAAYAASDGPDRDADAVLSEVGTLLTFVRGHVTDELADREAARRSGLGMADWLAVQSQYGDRIIGSGDYPHLSRIMLDAKAPHDPDRFDLAFRAGLDRILVEGGDR